MHAHRLLLLTLGCIALPAAAHAASAEPWWMAETRITPEGALPLAEKPWWARAQALAVGEQFVLTSEEPGGGLMIVRREQRRMVTTDTMIVWILDDDGDMDPANPQGDTDSDCYVADYGGDGVINNMLDWIDEDGDDDADIMEFRYFTDGTLRVGLNAIDLDDDNLMKTAIDYQRLAGDDNYFLIDTRGDSQYYHQKYDPYNQRWIPASECPFSFHDLDGDGQSEMVLRFSAVPREFSVEGAPDWANQWRIHLGPWDDSMNEMGVVAIRYSFDVDNLSRDEQPHHYEMGFNLNGYVPYDFKGMERHSDLRRPPQTNYALRPDRVVPVADHYPAGATGFSFREFSDGTINLGYSKLDHEYDQRWEGIFWTWHRRFMQNTGGPVQYWNIRREYDKDPAGRRAVYYSPVDRRLHLEGAEEGWLRVGAIGDKTPLAEIRTYDTDDDGFLDRWEWFEPNGTEPYRVAEAPEAKNIRFGDNYKKMFAHYNETAVPEATRLNEGLLAALRGLEGFDASLPANLTAADEPKISPGERRYLLDVQSEILYRRFRNEAEKIATARADGPDFRNLLNSPERRLDSQRGQDLIGLLSRCDRLYARGELAELTPLIGEAWSLAQQLR